MNRTRFGLIAGLMAMLRASGVVIAATLLMGTMLP